MLGERVLCGGPHSCKHPFTPVLGKPDKLIPWFPKLAFGAIIFRLLLVPSKEGVGVCLHLPREGVPATVVKLEREQERKKGVEEGRGNSVQVT